jgi:hypothetical protein
MLKFGYCAVTADFANLWSASWSWGASMRNPLPFAAANRVKTTQSFEEMRQHILTMYQGVTVTHSFLFGSDPFDCIPILQQPEFRLLGPPGLSAEPTPLRQPDGSIALLPAVRPPSELASWSRASLCRSRRRRPRSVGVRRAQQRSGGLRRQIQVQWLSFLRSKRSFGLSSLKLNPIRFHAGREQ